METLRESLRKESAPIIRHLVLTLLFIGADMAIQAAIRLPYAHLDLSVPPGLWVEVGLRYGLGGTILFFLLVFVAEIVILGLGAVYHLAVNVFGSAKPATQPTVGAGSATDLRAGEAGKR